MQHSPAAPRSAGSWLSSERCPHLCFPSLLFPSAFWERLKGFTPARSAAAPYTSALPTAPSERASSTSQVLGLGWTEHSPGRR